MPSTTMQANSVQVYDDGQQRALMKCYALLLALAENESADPGEPAGEQAPESANAITSIAEDYA